MATYKVKKGDNLTKIAKANNMTVRELAQLNNISNPNLIHVGQELQLQSPPPPSNKQHII